ncbi:hypothetical protein IWX90DRAFT_323614 [Phyllosticta citrichinensis]|uniref:Serine/threonine-protein kinase Tel1 n=1 Tax=Phyllosticta citrichinensis TaxID=1130410 RepID=A0ABR1XJT8_9PEZI
MAARTLLDALAVRAAAKKEDREHGEEEFKETLQQLTLKSGGLANGTCRKIFITLTERIDEEWGAFSKSRAVDNSNSAKGKARRRLLTWSQLVRLVVTAGVTQMRASTLNLVVGHFMELLRAPVNDFFEPIAHGYAKCLRLVLDHPPHVEHLEPTLWNRLAEFCMRGISEHSSQSQYSSGHHHGDHAARSGTPRAATPMQPESTARSDLVIGSQRQAADTYGVADDLVASLKNLVSAPNAPIEFPEPILSTLIEWLATTRSLSQPQVDAFAAINAVILKVHLESVTLVQQAIPRLIPLVRKFWLTKLSAVRDEMLATLLHSRAHVAYMLRSPNGQSMDVRSDVASLVETMNHDSVKRGERDQLQIDDLRFRCEKDWPREQSPFILPVFRLKQGSTRSEQQYAKLHLTAYFSNVLDATRQKRAASDVNGAKRPRALEHFEDCVREISNPQPSTRLHFLQVASFIIQQVGHNAEAVRAMLEKLITHISDANAMISSWAMLGAAACAVQSAAASAEFKPLWTIAWQLSSRNLGSESSSRAAAHVMDVILRLGLVDSPVVLETSDTIISSVELNGPATFNEAAASLWMSIVDVRSTESPHSLDTVLERMLRWFSSKWNPCQANGRLHTSHNYDAWDIIRLLCSTTDFPVPSHAQHSFSNLGPVAISALQTDQCPELVDYLILQTETKDFAVEPRQVNVSSHQRRSATNEKIVLDFCVSHIEQALQHLEGHRSGRASVLSHEMIHSIMVLCVVTVQLSWIKPAMEPLRHGSEKLAKELSSLVATPGFDQPLVDTALETLAPSLPVLANLQSLNAVQIDGIARSGMAKCFSRALSERKTNKKDAMEIDDEFGSQRSGKTAKQDRHDSPRDILTARSSLYASRSTIASKLAFMAAALEVQDADTNIPQTFLDYMVSLPPAEFMSCREFIVEVFSSSLQLTSKDFDALLGYAGDEVLPEYDHERSEVAICLVAELLAGTVELWSDPDSAAYGFGADLYEWIINILNAGTTSPHVLIQASRLFCKLLKVQPDYARKLKLQEIRPNNQQPDRPSSEKIQPGSEQLDKLKESGLPDVRTSLFWILKQGNVLVKYHVIESLPQVFGLYAIEAHDEVFNGVHENLPEDSSSVEKMALRMLGYARLGAAWHSLLRRCVYHIFETAGIVPESSGHAAKCNTWLSKALKLEDSRELFRIFAPQLIHTWIKSDQGLSTIPFAAFGYRDLPSLLRDVSGEVYSQLAMFGKRDDTDFLVGQLQAVQVDLAVASLPKTAAYVIAYDTYPDKTKDVQEKRESAMKDLLGDSRWKALIGQQFPCILAIFIFATQMDNSIEKGIERNPEFRSLTQYLREMQDFGSSAAELPSDQQPVFRSKHIFDLIKRTLRRANFNAESFWTADCFAYVFRYLLSKIHPALGSQHACSVIRKIRFLIALAGPIAWDGYPLQMTLASIRPYLTDIHCAEDTIGILQYLFVHGKPHLIANLSCLAGNTTSILFSLHSLLSSSRENNTAVEKATVFRKWFRSYIETCVNQMGKDTRDKDTQTSLKVFRAIAKAAGELRTGGNATVDTPESNLLMALLKDSSQPKKVLDEPSRDLAFTFLFRHFQPPSSFREDVLGEANSAYMYALEVWNSSQRSNNSREYLLWAAKVLGRSYSACGEVQEKIRRAARSSNGANIARNRGNRTSRMLIVAHLDDLLQGEQPFNTGLAEQTLRAILSSPPSEELLQEIGQVLPLVVMEGMTMNEAYQVPLPQPKTKQSLEESLLPSESKTLSSWIAGLCISLAASTPGDGVIEFLPRLLSRVHSSAEELFPYILHVVLEKDFDGNQKLRQIISGAFGTWFGRFTDAEVPHVKTIIRAILYLRTQEIPMERTMADRVLWLDIDYHKAAEAAVKCGMYTAALLFAECHSDQPAHTSRRSSVIPSHQPISLELQMSIYRNLEEPDCFYGVEQEAGLPSVLDRLDHESNGLKGLLFHGAQMDSHLRMSNNISMAESGKMVKDLTMLNLNSLTHSLLVNDKIQGSGSNIDYTLEAAQKLEQWEIRAPVTQKSDTTALYRAFQGLHNSNDVATVRKHLDQSFLEVMDLCSGLNASAKLLHSSFRTMATLNEIDEIMSSKSEKELFDTWDMVTNRTTWFDQARVEDFRPIISSRETLFSLMSKKSSLQSMVDTKPKELRRCQQEALTDSVDIFRRHGALQESLTAATYLMDLVEPCRKVQLETEADAKYQIALVLWDQGEKTTSVRMLQKLEEETRNADGEQVVSRAALLTMLGNYTSEARLKKPDEITEDYMKPAIEELKHKTGKDAGRAYHAYAAFCDQQLQSQDLIDDHNRMQTLAQRREADAQEFERLAKAERNTNRKETLKREARKARKWFNMDMHEAHRLSENRVEFLTGSLANYLLALSASEEHDKDVFRMFSLWLEYSHLSLANDAVGEHVDAVPKGKFVVLMNQMSSKLQAEKSEFQNILTDLVARICANHPYHGMNHIYSGSKANMKDEAAKSRSAAATAVAHLLKGDKNARVYWEKIYQANEHYHAMALMNEKEFRSGKDYTMSKYTTSKHMSSTIPTLQIPPITMHIPVFASFNDYKHLPYIAGFKPTMGIANGLSQPKVVTALTSDGRPYKQLYKSGNDDLRQDAIMEQVFEHVSQLLRSHPATRLRNLHIRTYRVVPLSPKTGVIEFVQNTLPLMSYLDRAHQQYYPKDWRQSKCREEIAGIAAHTHEERIKTYKNVCRHFNPVLRFFFLERFPDPDDWFEKRLAYARSTAAISILGHVLGLGDRHCHNILLDQTTGEVVHIDLGVAFEAGRVLPVPEVVPFRLTRDIVDAMGYTGTEGVFRRCCEFTLDTLRDERDSIMTILNVLRYDPLYSWSISPLKAKKMQEGDEAPNAGGEEWEEQQILRVASRKTAEEGVGEAGRALSVVERKLSKALSSAAAVAELIQQATDERNLAVLYAGWSAWC